MIRFLIAAFVMGSFGVATQAEARSIKRYAVSAAQSRAISSANFRNKKGQFIGAKTIGVTKGGKSFINISKGPGLGSRKADKSYVSTSTGKERTFVR